MAQHRIAVAVGSLRRESINRKLADALIKLAPGHIAFQALRIDDLPLYNQDDDDHPAPTVKRLKEQVHAATALLFVTPEYNRSIPGVLKNALDHASRPYGGNEWAGKPAGILSASIGAVGGAMAQQHLRNVLAYLDVPVFGQPEAFIHVRDDFFAVDGAIANADTRKFLQTWVNKYLAWIDALGPSN